MKYGQPMTTLVIKAKLAGQGRDFVGAIRTKLEATGRPGLIAEVKKASPSRGVIQPDFDPVRVRCCPYCVWNLPLLCGSCHYYVWKLLLLCVEAASHIHGIGNGNNAQETQFNRTVYQIRHYVLPWLTIRLRGM